MGIRRYLPSSSYTTVLWCCVDIYMYKHLDIFSNFNFSVFWKIFYDIARFSIFFFVFIFNELPLNIENAENVQTFCRQARHFFLSQFLFAFFFEFHNIFRVLKDICKCYYCIFRLFECNYKFLMWGAFLRRRAPMETSPRAEWATLLKWSF